MKIPKSIKYSETEKSHVWRIAKIQRYYPSYKRPADSGQNLLLSIRKNDPKRLFFDVKPFQFVNKKVTSVSHNNGYYIFSIRNGRLNLYLRDPDNKTVRTKNSNPECLGIPCNKSKPVFLRRFLVVLREFLKNNNYEFLPKINVRTPEEFNREIIKCIYPGLRVFDKDVVINKFFDPKIFRTPGSLKEKIRKLVGSGGKKTLKLFAENINRYKTLRVFELAKNKNLVPLEVLQELAAGDMVVLPKKAPYRKLLRNFGQDARIRLVKEACDPSSRRTIEIFDTVRFYSEHPCEIPKNLKPSWHDLHNFIYREHQKRLTSKQIFKYSKEIMEINGVRDGNLEIRLPDNSSDLIDWGSELAHCVGSYGNRVMNQGCVILGVFKDGVIKYCIELRGKQVVQFRGRFNRDPEPEDKEKVLNLLKEKEIVNISENFDLIW